MPVPFLADVQVKPPCPDQRVYRMPVPFLQCTGEAPVS